MSDKSPTITPILLDVQQVCQFLNVSKTTLYAMQSSNSFGVLPLRAGRKVLYRRNELIEYVNAGMPNRKIWQELKSKKGFL